MSPTPSQTRRRFLQASLLAGTAPFVLGSAEENPLSGPFDEEVLKFMMERDVPGGSLAVAKNGRLLYARGYGMANVENKTPVETRSLFRIASISKPITAAAVAHLIEQKKLSADDTVQSLLQLEAPVGKTPDARLATITIRHLLHHTAGWDRDASYDPMFWFENKAGIEKAIRSKERPPGTQAELIQFMWGQPLNFNPGEKYAYSNFGYCLLGRVIEQVTGQSYETFMKGFLATANINAMKIGRTRRSDQVKDEVTYYDARKAKTNSWFPDDGRVDVPYGGFLLERMDAHGGWLASATDLLRFTHGVRSRRLVKDPNLLITAPVAPVSRNEQGQLADFYYGWGFMVRPNGAGGRPNIWHAGSLPGTSTLLVERGDGLSWAILFNQRSESKEKPDGAIDPAMHRAAAQVKNWPEGRAL